MRAVLVLAGGRGSRMGGPKHDVRLADGRTMLEHVLAVAAPLELPIYLSVSPNPGDSFCLYNLPMIEDASPFEGPLAAIARAFRETDGEELLIVCCDQPLLRTDVLELLLGKTDEHPVLFRREDGRSLAPFPGLYPKSILPEIEMALARGERSPRRFLEALPCRWVTVGEDIERTLDSVNTMEALRQAGLAAD